MYGREQGGARNVENEVWHTSKYVTTARCLGSGGSL